MKTTVVHLGGIESILSTAGVEKKMCQHPGIYKVETNFMTGIEKDGAASIARTDAALGLVREFLMRKPAPAR
jgi:hypothetical protein